MAKASKLSSGEKGNKGKPLSKENIKKKSDPKFNPSSIFDSVFNDASIGMFLIDSDRKMIRANRFFQSFIKYSEAELKKLNASDITHSDDYLVDEKLFLKVSAREINDYTIDKRYITKSGETVYGRLTISNTGKKKAGKSVLLGFVEDISCRIKCETNLSAERNYLNTLLENIPDSIYFKDKDSRFLKISSSLARKHNTSAENILGKTDFDFFGNVHARQAFEDEQKIIKTGTPIIDLEEREDYADGHVTWVSTTKMPFKDEIGNLIGTFGISRNITAKKKNELTHAALLKISDAVFTATDMKSMFITIHEVLATLMPVKNIFIALYDEEKNLLTFPYYIDEYDEPREATTPKNGLTEYILRTGKAQLIDEKIDYSLREKGEVDLIGTPAKIWMGVPLKIGAKTIGVIVLQDYENEKAYREPEMQLVSFIAEQIALLIERKRNNFEIMQYTEELKQLNATKDKFFSLIAHDLKNPYITILGFCELLISDFDELTDEEKLFYLMEMKKSSEHSHALLHNLLLWSRSQTGFIEYHPKLTQLKEVIKESFDLLFSTAERKGIKLVSEIDPGTEIFADYDMVNTVIRNLISNAIKFTPRDGTISVSSAVNDGFINVSVKDTGIGMDDETVKKLFRIDESHTTPGTDNEAGSGLGLILCREFVHKGGGNIWANSTPGKGSTFTFSVPAKSQK
jgi:PAS domain S-box-containing protein